MNNINFTGTFINSTTIQKLKKDNPQHTKANEAQYELKEVNFVELDPRDIGDHFVIESLNRSWNTQLTNLINHSADYSMEYGKKTSRFFVVTEQEDNFGKMRSDKVLGIAEFANTEKYTNLKHFQVNPNFTHTRPKNGIVKSFLKKLKLSKDEPREYKGVGTAILNSIKNLTEKPIVLISTDEAIDFYKKHGFISYNPQEPDHMVWSRMS